MDCRDLTESISAFVDGETGAEETARVREHLASCPACRAVEARMRSLGDGVRQLRTPVPGDFRDAVFARLDAEGALPPKKKTVPVFWRRAAVPLAAAAALGLFLLTSREAVRERPVQGPSTARLDAPAPAPAAPTRAASPSFSAEEKEMIALLDVLSDPSSLEAGDDADPLDMLDLPANTGGRRGKLPNGGNEA